MILSLRTSNEDTLSPMLCLFPLPQIVVISSNDQFLIDWISRKTFVRESARVRLLSLEPHSNDRKTVYGLVGEWKSIRGTLENCLKLWEEGCFLGAFFHMPFVTLGLAIGNQPLSLVTRHDLIELIFEMLLQVPGRFSATGKSSGISQIIRKDCPMKTLWPKAQCPRKRNLCIALF